MARAAGVDALDHFGVEAATGHQQEDAAVGHAGVDPGDNALDDRAAEGLGVLAEVEVVGPAGSSCPPASSVIGTPSAVRLTSSAAVPSPPTPTSVRRQPSACHWLACDGGRGQIGEQFGLEALLSEPFGQPIGPGLGGLAARPWG